MKYYVIIRRSSTVIITVHCGGDAWVNVAYCLCMSDPKFAQELCGRIKVYRSFIDAFRDYIWIIKRELKCGSFWKSFRRGDRYYIERWRGELLRFDNGDYLMTDADFPF